MGWDISGANLSSFDKLYNSASCTADYRFNTYRRLSSLDGAANIALILASTALIVVSFIVAMYAGKLGRTETIITIGQNCLPIVMLALSILVSGAKYGSRAEKIHDCAQALNHFKKILKYEISSTQFVPTTQKFIEFANQYAEIISKYENHSKIDLSIESIRKINSPLILKPVLELIASIFGRGLLYYFYLFISITSICWMVLGVYIAIKEVTPC